MKKNAALKALLGAAFLIALVSTTPAQDATPAPSPSQSGTATDDGGVPQFDYLPRLAAMLGLSDAQMAQIKTILQTSAGQLKAIQEDSSLATDEKLAQLKALKTSTGEQLNAVLTAEQRQKFEVLLQQFLQYRAARKQ